ncbi:MAG: helix-turn-helix domain-containing protein [Bacillota bacterium]
MENRVLLLVGKRVREKRKERGLSQEELGERAGFHFSYIGGLERAEKNITLVNLQRIADALEIDIAELFVPTNENRLQTQSEKEQILYKINQLLWSMKFNDLKKVLIFLSDIMKSKK